MRTLLVVALLITATTAHAHPSVSVVRDSRGNIYYSDLKQVWQLTPAGKKSIAVPNVHTHELYVDAGDNLFGEHLWYEGEATDKWGHYVWRRAASGRIDKVIPAREGFLTNYSFVRDRAGTMYWADRKTKAIRKRLPDGRVTTHATAGLTDNVRWMIATPGGTLYLIDDGALKQVAPDGRVSIRARGLRDSGVLDLIPLGPSHSLQGIWADAEENVYVACSSGRVVKRVDRAGHVTPIARSLAPWAPTGGMIAPNGDLWIQEVAGYDVRLRKIGPNGRETIFK
jgi:hypothetical protein